MVERDDFDPRRQRRSRSSWPWVLGVLVVVGAGAGYFFLVARDRPLPDVPTGGGGGGEPPRQEERLAPQAPPDAEVPPPDASLPPLAESDTLVGELAATLSARPELGSWLLRGDAIRRFTVVVDNVAQGVSPRPHLGFLAPGHRFQVREDAGRLYVDPRSYERYNAFADVFASLDPVACANLYRRLKPLIDEAYRELGYPVESFDATLAAAISELLAAPVPEGSVELTARVTSYELRDPTLERLSPPQKHLLRMGPRNVRLIQAQLHAIATAIGLRLERAAAPPA